LDSNKTIALKLRDSSNLYCIHLRRRLNQLLKTQGNFREIGGKVERWVAKQGDGWLRGRLVAKQGDRWLRGRWVAKLVARLLATAALWVQMQTYL
jgi:hypothetical protein